MTARHSAIVGVFTGRKKSGLQTLAIDCRHINALCRDPPRSELATPCGVLQAWLEQFHLGGMSHQRLGRRGPLAQRGSSGSVVSTRIALCQLGWRVMTEYLALDTEIRACDDGVREVMGSVAGGCCDFEPDTTLFLCLCVMPTGCSWSLNFSRRSTCPTQGWSAPARSITTWRGGCFRDRKRAPLCRPGAPVLAPYVDNGSVSPSMVSPGHALGFRAARLEQVGRAQGGG